MRCRALLSASWWGSRRYGSEPGHKSAVRSAGELGPGVSLPPDGGAVGRPTTRGPSPIRDGGGTQLAQHPRAVTVAHSLVGATRSTAEWISRHCPAEPAQRRHASHGSVGPTNFSATPERKDCVPRTRTGRRFTRCRLHAVATTAACEQRESGASSKQRSGRYEIERDVHTGGRECPAAGDKSRCGRAGDRSCPGTCRWSWMRHDRCRR